MLLKTLELIVIFSLNFTDVVACSEHDGQLAKAADDHAKRSMEKTMAQWDKDYINVDQAVLYWVTLAANYLNIKDLL